MGFQYRKRTKGKSSWLNFSYSERNGLGMSTSVKIGGITHNFGGKRANRTSVDLGNGLKYVSYGPSKARKRVSTKSRSNESTYTSSDPFKWSDVSWIFSFIFATMIISTMLFETWPWKIVAGVVALVWFGYAYEKNHPRPSYFPPPPNAQPEPTLEDIYQYYRVCSEEEYDIFIASLREDYTDEAVDDFIQKVNRRSSANI